MSLLSLSTAPLQTLLPDVRVGIRRNDPDEAVENGGFIRCGTGQLGDIFAVFGDVDVLMQSQSKVFSKVRLKFGRSDGHGFTLLSELH